MPDYTNSGILFKNDSPNPKAPLYTGKINVDGTEYRLAAWVKDGAKGKFMSLKVSEFERQPRDTDSREGMAPGPGYSDGLDDEIPF